MAYRSRRDIVTSKLRTKRVVTIGGGTGSFTLLRALKNHCAHLTAIVTMADDGGSTGVLRDELGVLPPGDIRQCLVALSDDESAPVLRELFNFRFESGSLTGHSFGNLFLSAMEKMTDNFDEAVRLAGDILKIHGRILPITYDNVRLAIQWGDEVVRGEGVIDVMDFGGRVKPKLFLEPQAHISPLASDAIVEADVIIVAPGDVYTSLGALLVVGGVREALAATSASIIYVCNLAANPRQTRGWSVTDYADELERLVGVPFIDSVLYNTASPPRHTAERYHAEGEDPVRFVTPAQPKHYELIGSNLIGDHAGPSARGDRLASHRSYLRHDAEAVCLLVERLIDRHP